MDSVRCPSCGEENPSKFRLCGFCGTSLAPPETVSCPSCGEENPGKFRLCGFCGTPLGGAPAPGPGAASPAFAPAPAPSPAAPAVLPSAEVRKPATFIFVDLKGSTALTERIDQEAMSEIKRTYFTAMAAQVERHGGTIEKYIGDAIMAVFGIPKAREDDALRAVRAAHGMQQELTRLNAEFLPFYGVELANRTGVNTGEVVANTDPSANQQLATGDTVNVAARLEQAAPPNEILIGETTYDLVRAHVEVEPVEPLELKGKAERVPAYRLLAVREATAVGAHVARRAPLIGRDDEMARIRTALREALVGGGARLVTLVGEAGVGKSRLFEAAREEVADLARVVGGRCLPYGDGITFWPVVEVVRDAAGIAPDDAPDVARGRIADLLAASPERDEVLDRLASVIGLSPARYPVTEVFWAARKFLEVLAADGPVVVELEDIHDAEPTFLDLVEHLVETLPATASVLIVCAARLAILDKRPEWSTGERAERLVITALPDTETERLVEALLGGPVVPGLRSRVVEATEGNPLFTEQLVSMLVDKGHIHRTDEGWAPVDDVSTLAVPPTIQALLAARLDDLSREERTTIEPASVIGLVFPQPAVAELVPASLRPGVPQHLAALDRKQLVQREGAAEADDQAYRFRNLLIRDATYGSLLKRARAQMHERFVTWAERVNRERGREEEFEEILGYHLEQAYRYRTELGPIDAEGRSIANRAAAKLGDAGRRAYSRSDLPAAGSLLGRTIALLGPDDPARGDTLCDMAEVLLDAGRFPEARARIGEARQDAERHADRRLVARTRILGGALELFGGDGAVSMTDILDDARSAIADLVDAGDTRSTARGWRLVGSLHGTTGQYDQAAEASRCVIDAARLAGDRVSLGRGVISYALSALHGPMPVPEALARVTELVNEVTGDRRSESVLMGVRALLHAMIGEFDAGRGLADDARHLIRELGPSVMASSTSNESARIELLAGESATAEQELVEDSVELAALGERYFRSNITGLLAHARAARGDATGAEEAAHLTAELADPDDTEAQILWRAALAKVRATQGRGEESISLATEAARLAATTSDPLLQADALSDLATCLADLGRHDEAGPPFREALQLYESKGALVAAGRTRRALDAAKVR